MPDFIDNPKREPKKRSKRAQTVRQEPRQEAKQEDDKALKARIGEYRKAWQDDRDTNSYSEAVAIESGAYMDGILSSIIDDVQRIDNLTNKNDIYALNSLVNVKLKVHKAIGERARFYSDMSHAYARDGIEALRARIKSLESDKQ